MEHRIYFIIGDVLACVSAGAIGGWLAHSAVAGDLSMLFALFIGMFLGMVGGMLIDFLLVPFSAPWKSCCQPGLLEWWRGWLSACNTPWEPLIRLRRPQKRCRGGPCLSGYHLFLQARLHGEVQLARMETRKMGFSGRDV
jgi:hypothetical protein